MVQSKMSCAVAVAAFGLVLLNGVNFVAPNVPKSLMPQTFSQSETAPMPSAETSVPAYGTAGMALMATAAVGLLAAGAQRMKVARKATHGIKFSYSIQKDAYADLEFMNDVGYLPDGTPMNRAGNAINHPETIGPDPHTPGSPLPQAEFVNSIGYLPDGTPMNAAGNALNHPETMQPDMHNPGSPLPASFYAAEVGYLVDGTPMATAGNLSVQAPPVASTPASMPAAPPTPPPSAPTSVAAGFTSTATEAVHGIKFSYSMQKDAYADYEFINDVGYLPDGTPMNRAGNAINHPETIGPDPHTPGSPLPRAIFVNSVGYLPDGTPLNAAGNALNHPETMQPDSHAPGSPLPRSYYAAEVGYLVDGTDLVTAGNLSVQGVPAAAPAAAPAAVQQPVAAAFVGASAGMGRAGADKRVPAGFAYAVQKDAYADLTYGNDVGYLPDGTPMNTAGNCINHPETIGPDPHSPGSPLPRAIFVNDVGYLPDGTPMNRAGNAINHPETIGPDPHTPGSELPPSVYAADIGYLVDGTPLDAAGNKAVH